MSDKGDKRLVASFEVLQALQNGDSHKALAIAHLDDALTWDLSQERRSQLELVRNYLIGNVPGQKPTLKNCPFCGEASGSGPVIGKFPEEKPPGWRPTHGTLPGWYVRCAKCGASTARMQDPGQAAARWNMRKDPT